jgi:hypothetical protein
VQPVIWGLGSSLLWTIPQILTDYYYYKRWIWAIFNIVAYNSNATSETGQNLYGIEPWSFYLKNLVLNWNFFVDFKLCEYYFGCRGMAPIQGTRRGCLDEHLRNNLHWSRVDGFCGWCCSALCRIKKSDFCLLGILSWP